MKDIKGNVVSVGDKVVYVGTVTQKAELKFGTVTKIYGNQCSVDSHSHVTQKRILKI